jgi:DNA-binding MarR family transcriptional regulator
MFTAHWYEAQLHKVFKEQHITAQQYNALRIIKGAQSKPVSIKYIKARMIERNSDVSRVVEKLQAKDLISICQGKEDKRNVDITISEKGMNLCSAIEKLITPLEDVFDTLQDDEISLLNKLLDKLRG